MIKYFIIILILICFSCNNSTVVVNNNKSTNNIKSELKIKNDRAKMLWKNRSDLNKLKKSINLWEEILPKINEKEKIYINLYLSEAYYLLSMFKEQNRIENLKTSIDYSYKLLLETSPRYKKQKDNLIQDYKAIKTINNNMYWTLYLYLIAQIMLRIEEKSLLLYRDDILTCIEHLEKISPKDFYDNIQPYKAYFYFYLPKIGKGSKEKSKSILEKIQENNLARIFYIELFENSDKLKNYLKEDVENNIVLINYFLSN